MNWLSPGRWLLCGAFIAALLLGVWRLDVSRQAIGYDRATAEQAVRDRQAESDARTKEATWKTRIDEVSYGAQKQIDTLQIDLSRANVAASGLRTAAKVAAKVAASRARADSGTADAGTATGDPAPVLADVLIELDERAGIYAEAADKSRIAGLACEKVYGAVK